MWRWPWQQVLALTFAVELGVFEPAAPKGDGVLAPVENPNQITGGPSKISGFDKNNLPFEINAQRGVQDAKVESLVHLQTVDSVFARPNGAKLNITSKGANYETKTKDLDLVGDVVFAEGDTLRRPHGEGRCQHGRPDAGVAIAGVR